MTKYEYKNSGIEWIGEVPKHWRVERLKDIASVVLGKMLCKEDKGGYFLKPYLKSKNVGWDNLLLDSVEEMWFSEKEMDDLRVHKGDLVVSEGGEVGKTSIWDDEIDECYIQNSVHKITFDVKNHSKYFLYQLVHIGKADVFKNIVSQVSIGHLTKEKLVNVKVVCPPKSEQTAIAAYLDKACADIDRVVEIKRQQIENLKQQLKSELSIFYSSNFHTDFKDTKIQTLPQIPKHWQLKKLKHLLSEKLQYGANEAGDLDNPEHPRYIRITDFNDTGELKKDTFKSLPPDIAKDYLLKEDDILFARSGATVGKTFIFKNYNGVACFAGYLIKAATLKHKLLSGFLYYYTKTLMYENWKDLIFTQATIQNIGADKYQYLPVPVPPIEEQERIVRKTEKLINTIQSAQSNIEKQIETLLLYKKSLIHEVVTGKKQVYFGEN